MVIMVLTQISPSAFNRIKRAGCFLIFFKGGIHLQVRMINDRGLKRTTDAQLEKCKKITLFFFLSKCAICDVILLLLSASLTAAYACVKVALCLFTSLITS